MPDWTKPPYDKISHSLIGVAIWLPYWLAGAPWLGVLANVIAWYFREQAQEWHMCHRCRDAYFPWRWRRDSLMDAAAPVAVVAILTITTN